eukprot:gnl/TRDRNA2_/TRDRNA2_163561_c0_seq1.p1 gnl/TRDRNA2_/TRDRNA2_163561_c0~~gnl/TRDRNA2_/TRDRNA2_163561_c0_seq1.p1  ORF type:complete len:125 (-),score=22.47 gnl/TRDRNA2_/TRDRNA2_163561_c0_seq1:74-448(-)
MAALVSFIWLVLMLPTIFYAKPLVDGSFAVVLCAASLTGLFVGATNPICFELCAELTYPVAEGISGNVMVIFFQVCSIILLAIVPSMNPLATTPLMIGVIMSCIVMLMPVRERYFRMEAELHGD